MVYNYLELVADTGIGSISNVNAIGEIENSPVLPYIACAVSRDGGFTYRWLSDRQLGQRGDRAHRVMWRGQGRVKQTKELVFKFESNGDWEVNIYSAVADVEVGVV